MPHTAAPTHPAPSRPDWRAVPYAAEVMAHNGPWLAYHGTDPAVEGPVSTITLRDGMGTTIAGYSPEGWDEGGRSAYAKRIGAFLFVPADPTRTAIGSLPAAVPWPVFDLGAADPQRVEDGLGRIKAFLTGEAVLKAPDVHGALRRVLRAGRGIDTIETYQRINRFGLHATLTALGWACTRTVEGSIEGQWMEAEEWRKLAGEHLNRASSVFLPLDPGAMKRWKRHLREWIAPVVTEAESTLSTEEFLAVALFISETGEEGSSTGEARLALHALEGWAAPATPVPPATANQETFKAVLAALKAEHDRLTVEAMGMLRSPTVHAMLAKIQGLGVAMDAVHALAKKATP